MNVYEVTTNHNTPLSRRNESRFIHTELKPTRDQHRHLHAGRFRVWSRYDLSFTCRFCLEIELKKEHYTSFFCFRISFLDCVVGNIHRTHSNELIFEHFLLVKFYYHDFLKLNLLLSTFILRRSLSDI